MSIKSFNDAFRSRERALENEFFMEVDRKLLANMKAELEAEEQIRKLAEHTGFDDEKLLIELIDLGVSVEALTAMSLIPLVLVAWADTHVHALERHVILQAANELGIETDKPAGQVLEGWLNTRPNSKLMETWKHYVHAVIDKLSDGARKAMKSETIKRARSIAQVSGGPLGLGVMSSDEKKVIAKLENAFKVEKNVS